MFLRNCTDDPRRYATLAISNWLQDSLADGLDDPQLVKGLLKIIDTILDMEDALRQAHRRKLEMGVGK